MPTKNKHNQEVGSNIVRSDDRIDATGEVFTPVELCQQMVSEIPLETLQNPESTFLDNSAGCGNFLMALRDELAKYHTLDHVVNNMIYAVEFMEDNHKELCHNMGVDVTHPHYVCHDSLTYDYSFGEPVGLESFFG